MILILVGCLCLILGFWLGYDYPSKYQRALHRAISWCLVWGDRGPPSRAKRLGDTLTALNDWYYTVIEKAHFDKYYPQGHQTKEDFSWYREQAPEVRHIVSDIEDELWDIGDGPELGQTYIRDMFESNNRWIRTVSWYRWRIKLRNTLCRLVEQSESRAA